MKLHLGCGSVWLEGYVNIDLPGPNTFLAEKRPDLVEKWKTTEDQYYARHADKTIDKLRSGPLDQEYVCDAYGDFLNIPGPYWECEEILSRQAFEHLSIAEAHKALDQIDGILKPNGILRLDVPDAEATLEKYRETGDKFYKRHFLGPRRNATGFHLPYTREQLRTIVEEHGFIFVEEEPNIHWFEAFCLRFVKPGPRAARDYVQLPDIPDSWNVLEVGPGTNPLPRANVYLDRDPRNLEPLKEQGKSTIIGELMSGLPQVPDKKFDYVFCAHVLEHVDDPSKVAATLSRIAKRGTMVVPSAMKDGMFAFEETEHQWHVIPSPCECGPPIFIRHNRQYVDKLRDAEMQRIASRLYRTGPNRIEEARYLRKWFYENEQHLDVVVHWQDELKVEVIG